MTFPQLWQRLIDAHDAERDARTRYGHSDLRSDQAMIVEAQDRLYSVEHEIKERLNNETS